jgi:hypothetical protein
LRVRAEAFRIRPEVAEEVARRVEKEPGVLGATTSLLTGSMVITYEPRDLELPALIKVLVRAGGLRGLEVDAAHEWRSVPSPGARLRNVFASVDDTARAQARGKFDVRVAVPGALATGGLAMFLLGRRRIPEWYDLLFWGFVTFVNLNPSSNAPEDTLDPRSLARVGTP